MKKLVKIWETRDRGKNTSIFSKETCDKWLQRLLSQEAAMQTISGVIVSAGTTSTDNNNNSSSSSSSSSSSNNNNGTTNHPSTSATTGPTSLSSLSDMHKLTLDAWCECLASFFKAYETDRTVGLSRIPVRTAMYSSYYLLHLYASEFGTATESGSALLLACILLAGKVRSRAVHSSLFRSWGVYCLLVW
jgi:hypothetical protein